MRSAACVGNCMFASLRQLIGEHYSFILAAGVVGALFGLAYAGGAGGLIGAGAGILLATVYGYIPRISDCVGECPIH